jgi:hypothetical protein
MSPIESDAVKSMQKSWFRRFALGVAIMISLSAARLVITWRDYATVSMEQIGFPFVFFERGGLAYQESWYYEMIAVDVIVAIAVAYGFAHALRNGWTAAFRRLQTCGLDHVYEAQHTDCEMRETKSR